MRICESQIRCLFRQFNKDYFGNILPMPYIKIRHSVNTLGYFSYMQNEMSGTTETLEISDFYAYTSNQLRDIVVHEMIHYYLYYIGEDVRLKHGKSFMRMARQLNQSYGLHVTPTIDLTRMKPRPNAPYLKRLLFKIIS
jgi:predicted SprT family Zn-dependent metalloprotease